MVVLMRLRVNIESQGKLSVTLQPSTLIVTFESLRQVSFAILRSQAFRFLLVVLTRAGDKDLVLTRLALITSVGGVALVRARMPAASLFLSTGLLTCCTGILALARLVTCLSATVSAAL